MLGEGKVREYSDAAPTCLRLHLAPVSLTAGSKRERKGASIELPSSMHQTGAPFFTV